MTDADSGTPHAAHALLHRPAERPERLGPEVARRGAVGLADLLGHPRPARSPEHVDLDPLGDPPGPGQVDLAIRRQAFTA